MTDITIPAHEAKNLADFLRRNGIGEHHPLIRLLDPPVPSLRDEAVAALEPYTFNDLDHDECADAVLAVVRKRVEALPQHSRVEDVRTEDMRHHVVAHLVVDRADLFALLDGAE